MGLMQDLQWTLVAPQLIVVVSDPLWRLSLSLLQLMQKMGWDTLQFLLDFMSMSKRRAISLMFCELIWCPMVPWKWMIKAIMKPLFDVIGTLDTHGFPVLWCTDKCPLFPVNLCKKESQLQSKKMDFSQEKSRKSQIFWLFFDFSLTFLD